MTAAILVGVIAVVVLGVVSARAMAARADGRSIERHERLLGTLGGVARKSDASAPVVVPAKNDVARPHVRVAADDVTEQAPQMIRPEGPPRIRLEPLETTGSAALPVFEEVEVGSGSGRTPAVYNTTRHRRRRRFVQSLARTDPGPAGVPIAGLDHSKAAKPAAQFETPVADLTRKPAVPSARAVVLGLVAVVIVTAAGTLAWDLDTKHPTPHSALRAPAVRAPRPTTATVVVAPPTTVEPTAISHTVVAFSAPKGGYTFTFSAEGPCWIGIERVVNGPYLWMKTLGPGLPVTFHTRGPAVVRIGAPQVLTMQLNGVRVALPASNVNPFDATFS